MTRNVLSVEELHPSTVPYIVKYWLEADENYLVGMGVDLKKLPTADSLSGMLLHQLALPIELKKSYCIIWLLNDKPVGHSNLNPVAYGEEGYMHMHLWSRDSRGKGLGVEFLKMTLPHFFNIMQIKKLICEPYALNEGPNRVLNRLGFNFIKEYITTPGSLNFEQPVKRWELSFDKLSALQGK